MEKHPTLSADFEVVVTRHNWNNALRTMASNPDTIATGLVRRDPKRVPTGLLVDQVDTNSAPVTGTNFAPLADWIAIAMPSGNAPDSPDKWIERLKPGHAQLLVLVLIGFGSDRSGWRAWTIERGIVRPLMGLHIVGPESIHVSSVTDVDIDNPIITERWSRTIHAVGEAAFKRLQQSSVVVIGASRTGSLAASMFAALGVRRLGIVDGDKVESHNLDCMLCASESDIGKSKAIVVARHLAASRSDLAIFASSHPFGSRHEEPAIGDADLIVTCVDQPAPRLRAAHLARCRLIPHLDVATGVTREASGDRLIAADVRLLLPQSGCVRCVGGVGDLAEAEYELRAPPGALPRRAPEPWNARGRLGSLVTLNAMAVSTGIQTWLDLLDDRLPASIWHRVRWTDNSWEVNSGPVVADEQCTICKPL